MATIDMQDDLAAHGVRLATLKSVVRMAKVGLKTRGVTPSKAAKALGYTGPANLDKILAWVEVEQAQNLDAFQARNAAQ